MILTLLGAALSMAVRDALGTMLTVAEAKGRQKIAATCDALGDLASIGVTLFGAGEVIVHGWSWRTVAILAVMVCTSWVGTYFWTGYCRRF